MAFYDPSMLQYVIDNEFTLDPLNNFLREYRKFTYSFKREGK